MKVCAKCGVEQNDANTLCVECGAVLPDPVSEEEEERREYEKSQELYALADRTDLFYRTRFDWAMIIGNGAGLAAAMVILFFFTHLPGAVYALTTVGCCGVGLIIAAFPKLLWKLEEWRVTLRYDVSDLSPSYAWLIGNKVVALLCLLVGGMNLLLVITK